MNSPTRRTALKWAAGLVAAVALDRGLPRLAHATDAAPGPEPVDAENRDSIGHSSNFRAIYQNPQLKAAFRHFLVNVYHLYPEDSFHDLIARAVEEGRTDQQIYRLAQLRLDTVKPFLGDLRYSLPALARQKQEMAHETLQLLGPSPKLNGYMEIGTTGRYISRFKSDLQLTGDLVLVNALAPAYNPIDIVERGQLTKIGRFVPLNDYAPIAPQDVADHSLDVVANYIGFHHSPPDRRDAFVRSVARVLRHGGRLLLRDHDVDSEDMNRMVALAHDVFNMGLGTPWETNQREIRNFTSINAMVGYLAGFGLQLAPNQSPLFQNGDPTHNALMNFIKI